MIPQGSKIFRLKAGTKVPATRRGHLDAKPYLSELGYPNWNYGIALDDMFIVVDFDCDHPEREAFEASLIPTWTQRTARIDCIGMHYLYRTPPGFQGRNTVYKGTDGKRIADIKCHGYIVGPGSRLDGRDRPYTMLNEMEPVLLT